MKNLLFFILLISITPAFVYAQDGLPEKPEDGGCYAKCVTPDEYKDSTVRVMVRPAYQTVEIVPAQYKTVVDTIITRPASKQFKYIAATYKTVRDTQVIKESYNKLTMSPEVFTASSEVLTIKPAIGRWEAGGVVPDCESTNPEDCRMLCYREYPALTQSIPTQVLNKSQTADPSPIRAQYKVITKEVEVSPARVEETIIPARYTTITRQVLVKDETIAETTVPAEYQDVTVQRLVKKGGLTYWKSIACELPKLGEILPINYELGSAALTSASKRIIDDKLYQFLMEHPDSRIELSSHTDSRGSASSNLNLSKRRAQSVVNYLVGKGIDKNRLIAVGKGETELLNRCADGISCSESEHQANRRTTFRVISY
ncbi:MAG: OmpA family protein, partial [Bacteroidota bacterium]